MTTEIETKTERGRTIPFDGQGSDSFVRIYYRRPGERRWRKRLVFAGNGMTLSAIESQADEIAAKLLAAEVGDA